MRLKLTLAAGHQYNVWIEWPWTFLPAKGDMISLPAVDQCGDDADTAFFEVDCFCFHMKDKTVTLFLDDSNYQRKHGDAREQKETEEYLSQYGFKLFTRVKPPKP